LRDSSIKAVILSNPGGFQAKIS